MISKTLNRYVWLVHTLLKYRNGLTIAEISQQWEQSSIYDGKPLAVRTFHQHEKAIEELFGLKIECNSSTYRYRIVNPQLLGTDRIKQWLYNSFAIGFGIQVGRNLLPRLIFENVENGVHYLPMVIGAMQDSKELEIDYQTFGGHRYTYHYQPYSLKVYHQRWYILGYLKEQEAIRHLALDRILDMTITTESFILPADFNANKYYADVVGIFVDNDMTVENVVIRAFGKHVEYLRTLPLHRSQEEIRSLYEVSSDFRYRLCLTPDLVNSLLAMGDNIEVLEPASLRDEIKRCLLASIARYQ